MPNLFRALTRASFTLLLVLGVGALAHEGEDHANEAAPVAATPVASAGASGKRFEVAVEAGADRRTLVIFVDDWATNAPVPAADVAVRVRGETLFVPETEPGLYTLELEQALQPGEVPLSVEVASGEDRETIAATLPADAPAADDDHDHTDWRSFVLGAGAMLAVVLLLLLGRALWQWRAAGMAALLLPLAFVLTGELTAAPALAGGDHDHGDRAKPVAAAANRAVRQPDGSLLVPKAVQRVLGLRTVVAGEGRAPATVRLAAQVVPDPSRTARLATGIGGRVMPVGGGFPLIGQRVAAGQPLFRVQATLAAVDAVTVASELRSLDREIRLAQQEYDRVRFLKDVVAQARIDAAVATLEGLKRQRAAAAAPVNRDERVTAPFAGRVTRVAAAVGEIAQPGQVVVEIAGDGGALVEARGAPALAGRAIASAVAVTPAGVRVPLRLVGRSPTVTGGVETLQLRGPANAALRLGDVVQVEATLAAEPVRAGVLLPAAAMVVAGDGQRQVFVKRSPLSYAARVVRATEVPGGLLVTAGLAPGERVVTAGAQLLAQVR